MTKFAITIPCFNEGKNVPLLIKKIESLNLESKVTFLIVDNGSTDKSFETLSIKSLNIDILRIKKNMGYGFGIISGLKKIQEYDIIGWTHADLQTDITDITKAIKIFEEYGDNCFVKGKRIGRPFADNFFTIGMSIFESFLFKTMLWDINAQPTLFPSNFFKSWSKPPNDFSLDLYSFIFAKRNNFKVFRFPVFFHERIHGASSWNIDLKSKYKFIKRTLNYSIQLKKDLI